MDSTSPTVVLDPTAKAAAIVAAKAAKAAKAKAKATAAASEAAVGKSVDASVQHTNDDSVLSKRSAAKHGYLEDEYLRFFVKKPARRAPLINRGYYLRIVAMTELVEQCLRMFSRKVSLPAVAQQQQQATRLQVLSLGAGFDTLAPRLYLNPAYKDVHFYEVDFPPVIANKTGLVAAAPSGSFPFMAEDDVIAAGSTTMNFGRYHSLGLDLRDTEKCLSTLLTSQGFDHEAPTVVYAECVMQYMTPDCSDGVVRWAAANLPNAIFMAYDQINPYDSFGGVMQHSLRSKCSPLAGVHDFPNGIALSRRAVRLGLEEVRFANFYDLSQYHIADAEKARVDNLEMFDEYEEWCEMCEHYGILCARTRKNSALVELPQHPALVDVLAQSVEDIKHLATLGCTNDVSSGFAPTPSSAPLSVAPWPNARLGMECYCNGSVHSEFIGGDARDPCVVAFGGVSISKGTTRTEAIFVHSLRDGDLKIIDVTDEPSLNAPTARSHHSFTRIAPFVYVAFGGRTNPTSVFNEAFLCEISIQKSGARPCVAVMWRRLIIVGDEAPLPRFRHADVALVGQDRFFIIGGRGSDGASRLGDVWLASVNREASTIAWQPVALAGADQLPPHCTAAACLMSNDGEKELADLIVAGGMAADDTAVGTAFHLRVDTVRGMAIVSELAWAKRVGSNVMGRYAHTLTVLPAATPSSCGRLLIFGGLGFVPKVRTQYWQPLMVENPLDEKAEASIVAMPNGFERVSFVRHSVVKLGAATSASTGETSVKLGVVGGGFTCFSFGIYSPNPILLTIGSSDNSSNENHASSSSSLPSAAFTPVPVKTCKYSVDTWEKYHTSPFPVALTAMPIGPCTDLWKGTDYMKETTRGINVAVHVANQRNNGLLDFVHKNFDFKTMPFADLIEHCWPSTSEASLDTTWYYRSVGSNMKTESSNFFKDFGALSKDFVLPNVVSDVVMCPITHHQSCFRINQAGMRLWPHYDVMDNILVNVVGKKQVVLFPPTEYANLYMSGSSSPVLDVMSPDVAKYPRALEALKAAQIITLEAGDCLVIPALWVHAITALEACVSVNLFYKRLSMMRPRAGGDVVGKKTVYADPYDAKDLYGNKDLPSMVAMRKALKDSVTAQLESDADTPAEFKALMIQQLISELQETSQELFVKSSMKRK